MSPKFQSSRNSKRTGLAALIIATILLASCPDLPPELNLTAPAAPGNLRSNSGDGRVRLSWEAVSGAASYYIYRDDMRIAINTIITTLTYTDNTAVNGDRYIYTVRAVGSNGLVSLPSNPVRGLPLMINFDNLALAQNENPVDIWSDGTTMWVLNSGNSKIFAYNLIIEGRESARDFNTLRVAGNNSPIGMWSDGTTMWVLNWVPGNTKIFAYNMRSKERDESQEFNGLTDDGPILPDGIWSNGSTMWVVDRGHEKIFAYNMRSKERDESQDIGLAPGNGSPRGIWSYGDMLWVSDDIDSKLYAYNLSGVPVPDQDFDSLLAAENGDPFGMWSNADTMWVVDNRDNKIYTYNLSTREPIEE